MIRLISAATALAVVASLTTAGAETLDAVVWTGLRGIPSTLSLDTGPGAELVLTFHNEEVHHRSETVSLTIPGHGDVEAVVGFNVDPLGSESITIEGVPPGWDYWPATITVPERGVGEIRLWPIVYAGM